MCIGFAQDVPLVVISKIMKGIIYCRVSSHDQVQGTSLENQQSACQNYAKDRNIEVSQVFIERGESATTANRPELLRALEYCHDKKDIEAFIVWKIDRFSRKAEDHYALQTQLNRYGTRLHSVTEEMINDGAMGKMMEAVFAGVAQLENDTRKLRCTSGMSGAVRNGLYVWDPKFGYKRAKRESRRITLPDVQDEITAPLLRKGMLLYAQGNTSISELEKLGEEWGLRSRTGKTFIKQRWSQVLADKFYAGIVTDPWSFEEYPGRHEPLITMEEFEKIQAVKNHFAKHKQARIKNILNSLLDSSSPALAATNSQEVNQRDGTNIIHTTIVRTRSVNILVAASSKAPCTKPLSLN